MPKANACARATLIVAAVAAAPMPLSAQTAQAPDFSGIWGHLVFPDFAPPLEGPGPVTNLSRLRGNLSNVAPFNGSATAAVSPNGISNIGELVGDYKNPILKPEAAAIVKKQGDLERQGSAHPTPANQCWPGGVPFVLYNLGMQMIQQKDKIIILYAHNNDVRHVRLNAQHPARVVPSWFGDSIGHYEGDTLIVDTVGIKVGPFAMVDMYGTPHTERLHVVERYRLLPYETANEAEELGDRDNFRIGVSDNGLARNPADRSPGLLLDFTVDDPGVFTTSWSARIVYRRPLGSWPELICADSTSDQVGRALNIPKADKPDF